MINLTHHVDPLPPLQALQGQPPVVCCYDLDDAADSLCDQPGLPAWVGVHAKHGGHHFDGGYGPLVQQMLQELPARQDAPETP